MHPYPDQLPEGYSQSYPGRLWKRGLAGLLRGAPGESDYLPKLGLGQTLLLRPSLLPSKCFPGEPGGLPSQVIGPI